MLDPAIRQLLREDRRYPLEAYVFVFEALNYAQNVLGLGDRTRERTARSAAPGSEEEEERTGQCDRRTEMEASDLPSEAWRRKTSAIATSPGQSCARPSAVSPWNSTATWPRRC